MKYAHPNLKMIKDRGLLKEKFFPIMYQFTFLVLKSDGEYLLGGWHYEDTDLKKLLKSNDWSKYKKDWEQSVKERHGKGMFKARDLSNHKKHCF